MGKVIVILPALNEEQTIGQTIRDVQRYMPSSEIVVADNSSTDRTASVGIEMGATVVSISEKGKGRAVRGALKTLGVFHNAQAVYYIMIDGDFTYPAKHIPEVIKELENGADVVMGYRKERATGSMTLTNLVGNKALSFLASVLHGHWVKDICTGMWGFRGETLGKFQLTSDGFALEAELFGNVARNGCKLKQIPISYRARPDGSRAKLKIWDGFIIAWFLIRRRFK